jgi:hypothetical protein
MGIINSRIFKSACCESGKLSSLLNLVIYNSEQMMNKYFLTILIFFCIANFCCDSVHVFDAPATVQEQKPTNENQDTMLLVKITGGLYNLNTTLTIRNDGIAKVEGYDKYQEKRSLFKQEELSSIQSTFKKNNFMTLEPQKNGEIDLGANSVRYEITFNDGQSQKTIPTNSSALDNSMQPFIEEIYRITDIIINDGLSFELSVDKTVVQIGESLMMTFTVTNTKTQPIDFKLNSTQTHDIYIKKLDFTSADTNLWNWANTRAFENINNYRTLGGETTTSFVYTWNCQDNKGTRLQGQYSVSAELLSWPGGITKPIIISVE